ncbi:MAG TPA: hypothetical protein ENK02_08370 [Planctomycetes bacterium]|nr:hypothetical protein [Planctomycetota bacterium]
MEPKWMAIGLTVLVLVGGAWKVIASMSGAPEQEIAPSKTEVVAPIPEDGSYCVFETSWEQSPSVQAGGQWEGTEVEADPKDPNHMPYDLSDEDRAFALKAAKTWKGLPIAIEGRE